MVNTGSARADGKNLFIKAVQTLSMASGWCASGMIFAAVAITCQMIFVRFALNGSTVWQTEAVIYLMVAATLIGLPFVQKMRGHVNVDLVPLSLPYSARYYLKIFTLLLSIAVVALMFWYGFEYWHLVYSRGWTSDTVWAVRLWIPYLSLPLGFGLFLLQLIADLVAVTLKIQGPFGMEVS